jgi:hypothetical protein
VQPKRIKIYSFIAALAFAIPQYAQISSPQLGLAQSDDGSQIQPVLGLLGSASLGAALALPASVAKVHLAPGQGWALGDDASGGLGLVSLQQGQVGAYTLIDGGLAGADLVAFSPRGVSAALLSKQAGSIQVVKGLDKGASLSAQFALPSMGASLVALAVSDAGDLVAGLFDDGGVYLLSQGSAQFITRAGTPAGIAFLPDQSSLALADGAAGTVVVIDGIGGSLATRATASIGTVSGSLILIASTADGKSLLLAGLGASSIVRVNLGDLSSSTLLAASSVSRLERFGNGNDFFFSGGGSGTALWILSAGGADLQTSFAQPFSGTTLAINGVQINSTVRPAGRN